MSDDEEIILTPDRFLVSASEKVSTGDYENYNPHATIEGGVDAGDLDEETRAAIRQRLLDLQHDLQAILERSCKNRIAIKDSEDWSDPME